MATVIWYLTPESPRWLLETDQHEESEKILRQIARQNGQDLEKSDFSSKFAELTSRYASAAHGWPLLNVTDFWKWVVNRWFPAAVLTEAHPTKFGNL